MKTIYIGGQDAITADGEIVGRGDLAAQTAQVLRNIETALAAAGASIDHVVKFSIFIVAGQDVRDGLRRLSGDLGRLEPPLVTAAMVPALAHPDFLVEVDAMAVVPEALTA